MSFPLETLIVVSIIMLTIGGIIGLVAGRSWMPPTQQRNLEVRLQDTQKELERYQHDVAKHFMDTAKKVSDLTESYRNLHDHLSTGAMELASPEISQDLIAAANQQAKLEKKDTSESVEQPKDWAPRSGSIGTLSENYGLDEKKKDKPKEEELTPPPKL